MPSRGGPVRDSCGGFAADRRTNTIATVRRLLALAVLVPALMGAACREETERYPPECSNGPAAMRTALARAPDGEVAIEGVRLSECMIKSQEAGPITAFGGTVIAVAQQLADQAAEGDTRALLELGYLRGVVHKGADATVHDELKFRLDEELQRVNTRAPAFRRGEAAGRERG